MIRQGQEAVGGTLHGLDDILLHGHRNLEVDCDLADVAKLLEVSEHVASPTLDTADLVLVEEATSQVSAEVVGCELYLDRSERVTGPKERAELHDSKAVACEGGVRWRI